MAVQYEDPQLIDAIRAGEPEALDGVIRTHLRQIHRAARGAGLNEHQAEEVTQAVFVTFVETAHRFEGRSKVRTWLFGILYRKLQEARRGFAKDRRNDDIDEVFESRFDDTGHWSRPSVAADAYLEGQEVLGEIHDCLEATPDRQRLAFTLREIEELETEEICKILGVTATNLGVMLFRARNRLRDCLETKGVRR